MKYLRVTERWQRLTVVFVFLTCSPTIMAQPAATAPANDEALAKSAALGLAALQQLRDENVEPALQALGVAADLQFPAHNRFDDGLSAAAGGLSLALAQLRTDEQYELLHDWTMPTDDRRSVRILTSVVPEAAPPSEFARALGQRPKKDSFAVATVGSMPGLFCSAWTMIVAADDAGTLRQLVTELEGLAKDGVPNAQFVLTLAKLRDSRSDDEVLKKLLAGRVAGGDGVPAPAERSDAVLVAAALQRKELGTVCEEIAERLNQFDFSNGTSGFVPLLRRLRAVVILKNRSPETDPRELFYVTPALWVAADSQSRIGRSAGAAEAIWLTHEEHVKRLAGPGDDTLLMRYPLTGKFELKGEVAELDHGGGGMTYGGLAFDANSTKFTLQEVQRTNSQSRVWPFVAPKEHRLFNRVNIRSDGEKITFLSNLHPGWSGTAASCASCPWLGLRAFGDGRAIFRNLELVGEPEIPREVHIAAGSDLRGWTATYGETVPTITAPFLPGAEAPAVAAESLDWHVSDGVIHGTASAGAAQGVAQSQLAYMRPCLDGETISYEFFYEEDKTTVHPVLGRLAFLVEPGGVRLHWLTDNVSEWTGLPEDNAVVEPLNRRGPRNPPLKSGEWNAMIVKLANGRVSLSLNGEEIYQRPLDDFYGRHFGFYHDRNKSAVQVRNVVLMGDWPEKLSAEQLGNLVAFGGD